MDQFKERLAHYYHKEIAEAVATFDRIVKVGPDDKIAVKISNSSVKLAVEAFPKIGPVSQNSIPNRFGFLAHFAPS